MLKPISKQPFRFQGNVSSVILKRELDIFELPAPPAESGDKLLMMRAAQTKIHAQISANKLIRGKTFPDP